MMKYARSTSAAFTWSPEGRCRGVLLMRDARGCHVSARWGADTEHKTADLAEALAAGRKALNCAEAMFCVAGPTNGGWGMAELEMPELKQEELRNALAFELRKRTPLPPDRLVWGYRVLEHAASKEERMKVRLFYVKRDSWRQWMAVARGLAHVDLIAPAPVLLDPLAEGQAVVVPGGKISFRYLPSEHGREEMRTSANDAQGNPLDYDQLFPMPGFTPGVLEELSIAERQEYLPAVILGIYALSTEIGTDVGTLPPVEEDMRPKRYLFMQAMAGILLLVVIGFLLIGGVKAVQARMARLSLIAKDIQQARTQYAALQRQIPVNAKEASQALEEEIARFHFESPDLPEALSEVTRLVKAPAWVGSFEWKGDPSASDSTVNILLREPVGNQENTNLVTRLSNSPVLGDVKEIQANQTRNNMMERRFVMTARGDTPEESVIAKEAAEEERRLEQQRKEEERAAKAKAEAEERERRLNAQQQEENEDGEEETQTRKVPIPGRTDAADGPPLPPGM
ncbi:MAG: hypothetical protein IJJ26_01515 [Victivallales bacterium]|nr:hypothetical protein [Victivallales bacterium]